MTKAPELQIETWLNTDTPISLEQLHGRVVMIEAFQLLCPGCVSHGLPQAQLVSELFSGDDVVVLGLHSVFEHHAAQGRRDVLEAFLHENRVQFPVGMDMPSKSNAIPETMAAFNLNGTPSTILIDREGALCLQHFGRMNDMALGAKIAELVIDKTQVASIEREESSQSDQRCDENGCAV